jgi:putative endonuclease
MKNPAVYVMANKKNGTLYVGVTSDLIRRVCEHRSLREKGFTQRYRCVRLVYYEVCPTMEGAIWREKQIKRQSRKYKVALIEQKNFLWRDLFDELFG